MTDQEVSKASGRKNVIKLVSSFQISHNVQVIGGCFIVCRSFYVSTTHLKKSSDRIITYFVIFKTLKYFLMTFSTSLNTTNKRVTLNLSWRRLFKWCEMMVWFPSCLPADYSVPRLADWNQLLRCRIGTELLWEESGVSPGQWAGDKRFDVALCHL